MGSLHACRLFAAGTRRYDIDRPAHRPAARAPQTNNRLDYINDRNAEDVDQVVHEFHRSRRRVHGSLLLQTLRCVVL